MNVYQVLVERLATALLARQARVATAESCTGGWIAKTLTDRPGSSAWFEYGFVCYGNNAKASMLGVSPALLEQHGAVSAPVAEAMVTGALAASGADLAIAVTGIAGPDGGTEDKPVGTVWFGFGLRGQHPVSVRHHFDGDRDTVRRQTVSTALSGAVEHFEAGEG
jgi:nicotinamide-nucleotide amidase